LRYILICDDYVFLNLVDEDDRKRADTPAMTHIPYRERMTSYDAAVNFSLVSGINDKVDIKNFYMKIPITMPTAIFSIIFA